MEKCGDKTSQIFPPHQDNEIRLHETQFFRSEISDGYIVQVLYENILALRIIKTKAGWTATER